MSLKAQLFSIDLVVSFVIAIFLASIVFESLFIDYSPVQKSRDLSTASGQALAQLIQSPGKPYNWSFSSAQSIGLASQRNVLDPERVAYFFSQSPSSHNESLFLLGLYREGAAYDYNLEIISTDATVLYSLSASPPASADLSVSSGVAVLNNSPVIVRLSAWVVS